MFRSVTNQKVDSIEEQEDTRTCFILMTFARKNKQTIADRTLFSCFCVIRTKTIKIPSDKKHSIFFFYKWGTVLL